MIINKKSTVVLLKYLSSFIFLFSILNGCSVEQKITSDRDPLPADMGVLVIGLHTNLNTSYVPLVSKGLRLHYAINGQQNFNSYKLDFRGSNFVHVVTLPAGTYNFFRLDSPSPFIDIKQSNNFTIQPNTITYVGDLFIDVDMTGPTAITWVEDAFETTSRYLKENYPNYSKTYTIEKSLVKIEQKTLVDVLTERKGQN
jgi:hypothetical protein